MNHQSISYYSLAFTARSYTPLPIKSYREADRRRQQYSNRRNGYALDKAFDKLCVVRSRGSKQQPIKCGSANRPIHYRTAGQLSNLGDWLLFADYTGFLADASSVITMRLKSRLCIFLNDAVAISAFDCSTCKLSETSA
jgi:hypothetical protein